MNAREDHNVDLMLFLDGQLDGDKQREFIAHLQNCAHCKASLGEERALTAMLRQSRPLYVASVGLRTRVAASLVRQRSNPTLSRVYGRIAQGVSRAFAGTARAAPQWKVLAPAVMAIALCLLLIPQMVREARAADYVDAAVSAHRNYLAGRLPLEFQSDSPHAVNGWLAAKIVFPFQLPDFQAQSGSPAAYRLLGARLVAYRGSQAGLVTYEGALRDTITLLVASSNRAVVNGGLEVRSGNLIFHRRTDSGLQIITWSNHGLTYALVSRTAGSARSSCLVCHQNMADRDTFRRERGSPLPPQEE